MLAALTCPCHAPLLVLLLSGTAAGAALREHLGSAIALMAVVFVPSLALALRHLKQPGAAGDAAGTGRPSCEPREQAAASEGKPRAAGS